ncbi:Rv3235 family protein, partial [Streptomyces sp.]|uniref:Rv3235 family protein n=1 Tax=Streptomyces sp. TaxID=1931 RepID=UPI002F93378E
RPGAPVRRPPVRALPPHALFAERLLAVLSGERPVHWMLGQTVGPAYEQLVQLAPTTPFGGPGGVRPVVRSCRVQSLPGGLEAFASVATGDRVRAMAFRLEPGADRRWRCAAVELDDLRDLPRREADRAPGREPGVRDPRRVPAQTRRSPAPQE